MSISRWFHLLLAALALQLSTVGILSVLFLSVVPRQALADFVPLGDLPGGSFASLANGVSADGTTVVGHSAAMFGPSSDEAFLWTQATGMVDLGIVGRALGVSADGTVVVGIGPLGAFRWTQATGMVGLGTTTATAWGVSADGTVVVGEFLNNGGAFRWTEATGPVAIGGRSAVSASADGTVVVGVDNSSIAFRWTPGTGLVSLGVLPGGSRSGASGVSADGAVVVGTGTGSSPLPVPRDQAFRWTQGTGMIGLGDLPGGDFFSVARAVSADGKVIVGESVSGAGRTTFEAFVWDGADGMRNLRDVLSAQGDDLTGWELASAVGVSADGTTIVGWGFNPAGQTEGWLARLPAPGQPGITTYRLTRIGDDASFRFLDIRDINEDGEMVGALLSETEPSRAILLRNGMVTELGDLAGGAAQSAVASAINDLTQITGSNKIQDASGNLVDRGFLWEGAQIRDLGIPGATPRDINNRGQIVGTTLGADNVFRPFLWEAGQTTLLETLDRLECPPGPVLRVDALRINNTGVVVGFSQSPAGFRAVIWQNSEIMSLEPPIPMPNGGARDVNDQGDVIGGYIDGPVHRSFLWQAGGEVTELLPLERAGPDADALVSRINNQDQIVGDTLFSISTPVSSINIATLWQDGAVLELDELISDDDPLKGRVHLFRAIAINEAGVIVARGVEEGVSIFTYALTPTGIPASPLAVPPPLAASPPASDNNGGGAVDLVSLLLIFGLFSVGTCVRRRQPEVLCR